MRVQPTLVTRNLETVVQPKLLLLKDFGIEGEHLAKVLTTNPAILTLSVQSVLSNITFFKNIFESHDLFIKTVLRSSFVLTSNVEKVVKPSLVFWEGCGVHGKELAQMVFAISRLLRISSLTPDKIDLIAKLGVKKESKMYKYILLLVAVSRMETLESKMHNLQMCGLSHEEVMGLFRASNSIFYLSKDNVRKKMDFIVNNMELSANFVVKHPSLLNMNFEKIVIPRFLVWKKMKSMDGIRHPKLKPLYTILTMAEANFVGKIVKEHPESTMLYSIYEKAKADASSLPKISTNSFLAIPFGGYKA